METVADATGTALTFRNDCLCWWRERRTFLRRKARGCSARGERNAVDAIFSYGTDGFVRGRRWTMRTDGWRPGDNESQRDPDYKRRKSRLADPTIV